MTTYYAKIRPTGINGTYGLTVHQANGKEIRFSQFLSSRPIGHDLTQAEAARKLSGWKFIPATGYYEWTEETSSGKTLRAYGLTHLG